MVSFLGVGLEFRNTNTKFISYVATVVALSAENKVGVFMNVSGFLPHFILAEGRVYKGVAIGIVPKEFFALDSTPDDMVKGAHSNHSGFSWHTKYK